MPCLGSILVQPIARTLTQLDPYFQSLTLALERSKASLLGTVLHSAIRKKFDTFFLLILAAKL
jgi:hypothetical protein